MIRKSTINLNYNNSNKNELLLKFIEEYKRVVNIYIDILWDKQIFNDCFLNGDILDKVETWLSARIKQCAGKQSLQIVKSQRKKKNKVKPKFNKSSIELDSRFIEIQKGKNSFDLWIKISSLGDKMKLILPSKKHYHFNKFNKLEQLKSTRLRVRDDGKIFLDIFFKIETEEKKKGEIIGLDCGYKKLAVMSDNKRIGVDLNKYIEKISSKVQKSKGFKRALITRNEYINKEIKKIDLSNIKGIVVEDLMDVKKGSKGKIKKEFNNKLQRWVYRYFLDRLRMFCEISGVHVHKINPSYTSRICHRCGDNHKENRNGEIFKCSNCGYTTDADYNASLNILNRLVLQDDMVSVKQN